MQGIVGSAQIAVRLRGSLRAPSLTFGVFLGLVLDRCCAASHVEQFPLVALYLPRDVAAEVLAIAEAADVGLDMTEGGLVRLYGRTDFDLHRFAQTALSRHLKQN